MDIEFIIKTLKEEGRVVAIKTDTVYGLVCNALDKKAVEKIYSIKNRDSKKPLAIFVKNIDDVYRYVNDTSVSMKVKRVMEKYWPGALTIIFDKKDDSLNHILGGADTIGIRIPNDKVLSEILNKIDFPLAQTSCNLSNEKEYRNASEIKYKMGDRVDLIVDGGEVNNNVPSTIISVKDGIINVIREGNIVINE